MKLYHGMMGFVLCLLAACSAKDAQLESALSQAGENRAQLEEVLDYYQDDSLKQEAAKFLIRNLPYHYSYAGSGMDAYYDAVDSLLEASPGDAWVVQDSLEKIASRFSAAMDTVSDVRVVQADYLIDNIERAFRQWREGAWARHLSFDEFCEYLLPYKSTELQPLDGWRQDLSDLFAKDLERMACCDLYKGAAVWACVTVNNKLRERVKPMLLEYDTPPVYRLKTQMKMPFGVCEDYVQIACAAMRGCGIPSAVDFTPQWPFRAQGHSWNVVLANDGRNLPFSGVETNPGEPHKLGEKMAKVYRKTYAAQADVLALQKAEASVPETFRNPCLKDVTAEYMKCADVTVRADDYKGQYAYLAVFDNRSWVPVAFAPIRGGKAAFKDVGRDIVYLPVGFRRGHIVPLGNPFLLTLQGEVKEIVADESDLRSVSLYRKYPLFPHVLDVIDRIVGGQFQAANKADFSDAVTFHTIEKRGMNAEEVSVPQTGKKYRYWRYYQPLDWTFCNIAEVIFVERGSGKILRGDVIGTEGSWSTPTYAKEAVFDGDLLTFFDGPTEKGGTWAGMDFHSPVDIGQIFYTPRADGNTIEIGDEYELFYWAGKRWKSLGRQTARGVRLLYEQVPAGGLYLLRDLTKGKEERIFTYEEGKQIFW